MTKPFTAFGRRRVLSCLAAFVYFLVAAAAVNAAGTISGSVYVDYNMNGVRNSTGTSPSYAVDGPVGGVTVTVYAPNGASKTASTLSDGTFSINTASAPALPAGPYRVEFTNISAGFFPSAIGLNNATTVRFVNDGGATGVDLGIVSPQEYCPNTATMVTNSYVVGTGTFGTLLTFPYRYSDELDGNVDGTWTAAPSRDSSLAPNSVADADSVGSTFGLAWNNLTNRAYAASFLKRGARFGTLSNESTGAIYQVQNPLSASPALSVFADLNVIFGANTAGANPHPVATTIDWTDDSASINQIGKVGLGGLKLSLDGSTLYTVNLADRRLYVIPTSGALNSTTVTRFGIPTANLATSNGNCASADVRPFALGRSRAGAIFVGAVCSAESETTDGKLNVYVWRFDNPGFTLVASNNLTFNRMVNATDGANWQRWANTTGVLNRAAPMLTDIEFDGVDMVLGLRDRYGDQVVLPDFYRGYGDVMRACPNAGNFTFESNGTCGTLSTSGGVINTGNGGREWFADLNGDGRDEGALGGLTQVPGFNHVITTFYDPVAYNSAGTRVNNFFTSGIQRYSNTTGLMTGAYDVYLDADPGNFGKADGIGDSEMLCEAPPLQIGNRVWNDTNVNGIQDGGETGVVGATLQLWADTNADSNVDTQVGSATTDASGNYLFGGPDNTNMSAACGTTLTESARVSNSSDDAEQNLGTNAVSINGTDLELTADGNTLQSIGIRFNYLDIPKDSTITNAYLEFTPRADQAVNNNNPTITIRAENTDNAATFAATASNISIRPTTAASATWSPANWTVGTPAQTSNLASVVQAVVNRAGWQKGNSMAFVLSGAAAQNFRRAWSFDGSINIDAPRLVVEYTAPCRTSINPNTRYEVRIPSVNFQTGNVLFGRIPSPRDNDPSTNGDTRDSDGQQSGGQVVTSLTTGNYGANNHTYDFGFFQAPTAANGAINGAVFVNGRGQGRILVTVSGGQLETPRSTYTTSFGHYFFDDLPVGETYVVSVAGKKYNFPNPSLVINLQDNVSDANFEGSSAIRSLMEFRR